MLQELEGSTLYEQDRARVRGRTLHKQDRARVRGRTLHKQDRARVRGRTLHGLGLGAETILRQMLRHIETILRVLFSLDYYESGCIRIHVGLLIRITAGMHPNTCRSWAP